MKRSKKRLGIRRPGAARLALAAVGLGCTIAFVSITRRVAGVDETAKPVAEKPSTESIATKNSTTGDGAAGAATSPAAIGEGTAVDVTEGDAASGGVSFDPNYAAHFTDINAPIAEVTVYSDRASVTRRGIAKVTGNSSWARFARLPRGVDRATIQADADTAPACQIEQVVLEDRFERRDLPAGLKGELEKLREKYGELLELLHLEKSTARRDSFLRGLTLDTPFARHSPATQYRGFGAGPSVLTSTLNEIRSESSKAASALSDLHLKIRDLRLEIDTTTTRIQGVSSTSEQDWYTHAYILLRTPTGSAGDCRVALRYMIANAQWKPIYDVRASIERGSAGADSGQIELVTSAIVKQQTGEDWKDVKLTVSSLDPAPLFLPQLKRWTLAEQRTAETRGQRGNTTFSSNRQEAMPDAESESTVAADPIEEKKAPRPQGVAEMPKNGFGKLGKDKADDRTLESERRAVARKLAAPTTPAEPLSELEAQKAGMAGSGGGSGAPPPPPAIVDAAKEQWDDSQHRDGVGNRKSSLELQSMDWSFAALEEKFPELADIAAQVESGAQEDQARPVLATPSADRPQPTSYSDSMLPAVQAQGRNIEMASPFPVTLASDEEARTIPLVSQTLKVALAHFAVPKHDSRAFVQAAANNKTTTPILAGPTQVFINGDLVSKGSLPTIAEGGLVHLDLGVDPNVEIKRTVTRDAKDIGLISKEHRNTMTVRIELVNHHGFPVNVKIQDQFPLSPSEKIAVKLLEVKGDSGPPPAKSADGILTWTATLPARGKQVLAFAYEVTYPENTIVSGLE